MPFNIGSGWPKGVEVGGAITDLLANHTLIVGQSRSGKSTAARRLIEEIVLNTSARVVVIDPNSDFSEIDKTDTTKPDADDAFQTRWADKMKRSCIVISEKRHCPPGLSWAQLSRPEKEAVLGLSLGENFAEYYEFRRHLDYERMHNSSAKTFEEFRKSKFFDIARGEGVERYRAWLEGVTDDALWVETNIDEIIANESNRLIIVDLAVRSQQVRYMTAARVLEQLWNVGEGKRQALIDGSGSNWPGTIVVLDEAHLFAPPTTSDPQRRLLAERIERLADQGKKLNLFLVLITQQPGKLNPQILAECNNRIVMRMNEQLSLRTLEEIYGGERGRYDGALTFPPSQGWALLEGALLSDSMPPDPRPRGFRFRMGRTCEGGGSPPKSWSEVSK